MGPLKNIPWFLTALISVPLILAVRLDPIWGAAAFLSALAGCGAAVFFRILPLGPAVMLPLVLACSLWSRHSPGLTDYLPPGTPVVFEGTVTSDPVRTGRGWAMDSRLEKGEDKAGSGSLARRTLKIFAPEPMLPGTGWRGGGFLNPGGGILYLREPRLITLSPPWEVLRGGLRDQVRQRFQVLKPQGAALASALFLGIREDLNSRESELFRRAGLSHILALSGSHLSLWASLLPWILIFLPRPWRPVAGVLPLLGFYVWLAGEIPSLQRAFLALVLSSLAEKAGVRMKDAEGLGAAWLVLLAVRPWWFGDAGFLLSFLAMTGLMGPGALFTASLDRLPGWLAQGLGASLGAFLTVLPLSLGLFGAVQWSGLMTGIPAGVLCASILVLCGLLLVPFPVLEWVTVPLLELSLDWFMMLCRWGAEVPLWSAGAYWGAAVWGVLGLGAFLVYKVGRERTRKLRLSQGYP